MVSLWDGLMVIERGTRDGIMISSYSGESGTRIEEEPTCVVGHDWPWLGLWGLGLWGSMII
jgi:hypothetical protein